MCVLILDGVVTFMLSWKPEQIQTAACLVSFVSDYFSTVKMVCTCKKYDIIFSQNNYMLQL